MAITLSKLKNKKAEVVIDLGDGDKLTIEYHPNRYTPPVEQKFTEAAKGGLPARATADLLLEVVSGWDLMEDDGKNALPVDASILAELGMPVLISLVNAIMESMTPGER